VNHRAEQAFRVREQTSAVFSTHRTAPASGSRRSVAIAATNSPTTNRQLFTVRATRVADLADTSATIGCANNLFYQFFSDRPV
jgi:hypothetical protein